LGFIANQLLESCAPVYTTSSASKLFLNVTATNERLVFQVGLYGTKTFFTGVDCNYVANNIEFKIHNSVTLCNISVI